MSRETGLNFESLFGEETDPQRFQTLNREQAARTKPLQNSPESLRLVIGMIQTAVTDASGTAKEPNGRTEVDWPTVIQARDWLRDGAYDAMVENLVECPIRPSTFQAWIMGMEAQWEILDASKWLLDPDHPVLLVEELGEIPIHLVVEYLLKIQYRAILAENEMHAVNQELAPVFQDAVTTGDIAGAVQQVAARLAELSPRIKWVGASVGQDEGRLERLQDIIERRGVTERYSYTPPASIDTEKGE